MCFVKPLKIKRIEGKKVTLENGIEAYYDKKVGRLKEKDLVIVYGNLILNKLNESKR